MTEEFGELKGVAVERVTLRQGGTRVQILTLGAILHEFRTGEDGRNVVLACDDVSAYRSAAPFSGAIVGPVANRLRNAEAEIDGAIFKFEANEGPHALHGGPNGTAAHVWGLADVTETSVILVLRLPDGEGGFPGDREITATYEVMAEGELELRLEATTDRPTLMNLAHHPHWTLDAGGWDGQELTVHSGLYLPTDDEKIPKGLIQSVEGSPFDFRAARRLSAGMSWLDHNYCLAEAPRPCQSVARLRGKCGALLDVATTAPGLQVFCGQPKGIALEPQHWPNAPSNPLFPSIRLDPGETYRQTTRYRVRP